MNTIQSWNEEKQDVEPVEIELHTKIKLGCEGGPVWPVHYWMSQQEIETIEEMCEYINDLDFNVQVVKAY